MNERKYPFVVGNNSREKFILEALNGLRLLARMGREAQEALDGLERDGSWNKPTFWAQTNQYNPKEYPKLKVSRFPKYHQVSPDNLPGLAYAYLELCHKKRSSYGGHKCIEYNLLLRGKGIRDESGNLVERAVENFIGKLRVNRKTISFVTDSAQKLTTVKQDVEAMVRDIEKASGAISILAIKASMTMVTCEGSWTQKGFDLQKAAGVWMVEQGHALRMLQQVIRDLQVKDIMDE